MRILSLAFLLAASLNAGTTGNMKVVVVDEKGAPLGGVTAIATSSALQGEQICITEDTGSCPISNLPPAADYILKVTFAEATSEKKGIEIYIDKTIRVDMTIRLDQAKGEVYQITAKAPHIDVASSTVGVNLTKGYIENVPMGRDRDFTNAMKALPSASKDVYGPAVGGATSAENQIVVDGMNSTDPKTGLSGTRLVLEFVDQFDVKEGGYGPEFGRATGGIINAATKSGSNEFHGSVFSYYRPGFLQASPRVVSKISDSITYQEKLGYYLNVGAELGGPIIQDKLWFHIGYSPEFQKDNWVRDIRPIQAADSSNQNPAKDAFGNFIFGPSTYSDTNGGFAQTHQYTFKLSHEIDNNNRHSLGVRGSPTFFTGAVQTPFDSDAPSFDLSADADSFKFGQWGGNVASGIYTYAGKYFNDKLKLDAVLGVHHQQDHWWPITPAGDGVRRTYYYADPLMGLESVWNGSPTGCEGTFLDKNSTPHCLARNYSKGGIGSFSDTQLTRISEKIMLTSLYDFAGLHQLKYGIDFEQLRSSGEHGYTGGAYYQFYDTQVKRNEYWIRGKGVTSKMPLLAQTLNWGAFVGDSWNPISNITINYGVRWEGQDFYGVEKPGMTLQELALQHKFNILDNWAPRAGVIWDFLGNGRGVVRLNYGRYFESIPMDLNQRAFGGEATRVQIWNVNVTAT